MIQSQKKQISALKVAITSLEKDRRRFAPGHIGYEKGHRPDPVPELQAVEWLFVEKDHEEYTKIADAIQQLQDMIEIIEDPGVTIQSQMELFEE